MNATKLPPDLYTVAEAADRLGVSESTAYRMVKRGELPEAIHVGRLWRVSKTRLERRLHGDPFARPVGSDDLGPADSPDPERSGSTATTDARVGGSSSRGSTAASRPSVSAPGDSQT